MSYKSKDVLNSFAKLASDGYLKKKASLNESLKKIAKDESLTPHQVEYVAAEANKSVWQHLFSLDKKASYDFEIADANKVVGGIQNKAPAKTDTSKLDYLVPPTHHKTASDKSVMGSFEQFEGANDATSKRYLKQQLQDRFEKLSWAKEEIYRQMIKLSSEIENLEAKFVKEANQIMIQTPFTERPVAMEKIAEFVRGSGQPEIGIKLLSKLASLAEKQGLVKQGGLKAPEEYISSKLPARIVNGNHVLFITIKTIAEKTDEHNQLGTKREIVDSSLPIVLEKVRAL